MASNSNSGVHYQLPESGVDKLISLVRLAKSIRQISAIRTTHQQEASSPAVTTKSLLVAKQDELSKLNLLCLFQESESFPGINTLHSQFAIFQDTLNRCVRAEINTHDGSIPGFEELMFSSGIIQSQAELLLEQNMSLKENCTAVQINTCTPLHSLVASQDTLCTTQGNISAYSLTGTHKFQVQAPLFSNSLTTTGPMSQSQYLGLQPHAQALEMSKPVTYKGASADCCSAKCDSEQDTGTAAWGRSGVSDCLIDQQITVAVDLKRHAHKQIISLWKKQMHTDVTFIVGEERKHVCAHRAVLASQSSYFESLLFGEMLEAGREEIVLDATQPELFTLLVEYAYTGELKFVKEQMQVILNILTLADRFAFIELKDSLAQILAPLVTLDNALTLLAFADTFQVKILLEKCLLLIDKNAEKIIDSEELVTLSPSTLQLIISRDTFFLPELKIYQAILRWRDTNLEDDFQNVLGCIRLSEIPARELFTTIEPAQIYDQSEITTALRIQIKPEFQKRRPRGKKKLGRNLFELAKFASSGNVKYSGTLKIGPPRIIDGIVELEAPQQGEPIDGGLQPWFGRSPQALPLSFNFSFSQPPIRRSNLSYGPKITSKMVEFSDVYLANNIRIVAFPEKSPMDTLSIATLSLEDSHMSQWRFSYKIRISKDKQNWETLFDFSTYDCYFDQTLQFPTQAIKYVDFELVSCHKPLRLKFISCSLEEANIPFSFLQGGIIGPLAVSPLKYCLTTDLPPGHPQSSDVVAMIVGVLYTPISVVQLRFKICAPESSICGDLEIFTSLKWNSAAFTKIGQINNKKFGNEVCLSFTQQTLSYILVHISNIKTSQNSGSTEKGNFSISALQCQ